MISQAHSMPPCKVGDRVKCPGWFPWWCSGNHCCIDGSTCPSAARNFTGCPEPKKVDCTSPSPSPPPPPPPPPPQPPRCRKKRGVTSSSLASSPSVTLDAISGSRISWASNWGLTSHNFTGYQSAEVEFVAMEWGHVNSSGVLTPPLSQLEAVSAMIGFNEPNEKSQAHLSPATAAKLWPQLEAAAKKQKLKTLVGPTINYGDVPGWENPLDWYDAFLHACHGCRVDAIGIHIYSCSLQSLQDRISMFRHFRKPMWIHEMACADDPKSIPGNTQGLKTSEWQCKYMKLVIPYLENETLVERYSWIDKTSSYVGESSLISNGRLTDLGHCYAGIPAQMELTVPLVADVLV